MPLTVVIVAVVILAAVGYAMGRRRSVAAVGGRLRELHSLPSYYGSYVALWCGVPSLIVAAAWAIAQPLVVG